MFSPYVTLRSGGYLVINQTEALVSIDVNSGKATREFSIEETALNTNLEAADEIARQLKLRDLAGLIVIDFIDMEERRNNRKVENRLKDALRHDRARIQVGRISHFGLMEMSRQRLRTGVLEGSTTQCPHCQGTGIIRSVESVALAVLRALEDQLLRDARSSLTAVTTADVALYILNNKRAFVTDMERRYGVVITVQASDRMQGANFAIERSRRPGRAAEAAERAVVNMEWGFERQEGEEDVRRGCRGTGRARRRRRRRAPPAAPAPARPARRARRRRPAAASRASRRRAGRARAQRRGGRRGPGGRGVRRSAGAARGSCRGARRQSGRARRAAVRHARRATAARNDQAAGAGADGAAAGADATATMPRASTGEHEHGDESRRSEAKPATARSSRMHARCRARAVSPARSGRQPSPRKRRREPPRSEREEPRYAPPERERAPERPWQAPAERLQRASPRRRAAPSPHPLRRAPPPREPEPVHAQPVAEPVQEDPSRPVRKGWWQRRFSGE